MNRKNWQKTWAIRTSELRDPPCTLSDPQGRGRTNEGLDSMAPDHPDTHSPRPFPSISIGMFCTSLEHILNSFNTDGFVAALTGEFVIRYEDSVSLTFIVTRRSSFRVKKEVHLLLPLAPLSVRLSHRAGTEASED
ncbi:hypothetical protein R1flu_020075 [Riccia fluitans]|uniref:Uncharacterized protein n=1 Tax=Riccia fluitans TaxID=41844 RepID=A0ABD1ZKG5_9MARC